MCAVKTWNKCSPCSSFHVSSYIHPARMFRTAVQTAQHCCSSAEHPPVNVVLTSTDGFTPPCSPNLASRVARASLSTGSMDGSMPTCCWCRNSRQSTDGSVVVGWLHLAAYVCAEAKAPDANVLLMCITTSLQQWSKKRNPRQRMQGWLQGKQAQGTLIRYRPRCVNFVGVAASFQRGPAATEYHSTGLSVGTFQG